MVTEDNTTTFSEQMQDMLFVMEEESWWFQYRAGVITGLMEKYYDRNKLTVDVGGGNGYTSAVAVKKGFSVCVLEPSGRACHNARKRGVRAHTGVLSEEYPQDGEYSQVLLLDVLEHIQDDDSFLKLMHRKMSQEGLAIITVPAYKLLWSSEDDYAGHFRRYTLKDLRKRVDVVGFDTVYSGYFMQFLFLPILIVRVFMERIGVIKKQDERTEEERNALYDKQFKQKKGSIVQSILRVFECTEYYMISKGHELLFGASIIMVIKKRCLK